jgi:protease I
VDKNAQRAYSELASSLEFSYPLNWSELEHRAFDGLILPGGREKGMREYLESPVLQKEVSKYFKFGKPVGAICHGVLLAARSKTEGDRSVLFGRKTTSLLKSQELTAWALTSLWFKDYYRTYPETVEQEVRANLASPLDFQKGPQPLFRDSLQNLDRGFVVRDRNYLSARWPGDAYLFATEFLKFFK